MRLGFRPLDRDELSPALREVRAREAQLGIADGPAGGDGAARSRRRPMPLPLHLVLYDGECGLCSRVVRWLIAADRRGVLHFAPLQGATAAALRGRGADIPDDLDSVALRRPLRPAARWCRGAPRR